MISNPQNKNIKLLYNWNVTNLCGGCQIETIVNTIKSKSKKCIFYFGKFYQKIKKKNQTINFRKKKINVLLTK